MSSTDLPADEHKTLFDFDLVRIAVTGHRPSKLGNEWDGIGDYSDRITGTLQKIIKDHRHESTIGISGLALGVDMLWAELLIRNKIPFIGAVPCVGQETKWSYDQRKRYNKIINHPLCELKIITASLYQPGVMQIRNTWMVDNCDLLVGIWDGSPGGTANCIEYAKKVERKTLIFKP